MSVINIRQLSEKKLRPFIMLPFRLYKNDPNWVAPLISDMKSRLNSRKNPFLATPHAFFLAERDGRPVARILAGIHRPKTGKMGVNIGYFSLFEAEDEASGLAVLGAAEAYCKGLDCVKLYGPEAPTGGEDDRALLVEGFGSPPKLYCTYNPEWYPPLFEKYGLERESDIYSFIVTTETMELERFRRVVDYAKKRYGFEAQRFDLGKYDSELKDIQTILQKAVPDTWDEVPPWEQIEAEAAMFRQLADPDFVYFTRSKAGEPLAFVIALPDYNQVLRHLKGRMFPLGVFKFLYWRRKIDGIRLIMQFCVPEYQSRGAVSACYLAIMENALKRGVKYGDAGTMGMENFKALSALEGVGGKRYRTFRWYIKDIK
jgi:hypothetical protein